MPRSLYLQQVYLLPKPNSQKPNYQSETLQHSYLYCISARCMDALGGYSLVCLSF